MSDKIYEEGKRLYTLGFAILWLYEKSKRPIDTGWTTGPRKSWDELKKQYKKGMNVGVRLGTPSKIENGFLAAIDCDIKSKEKRHRIEMRRALKKLVGAANLPKVSSGRGGGSSHLYCRCLKTFAPFTPFQSEEWVEYKGPSKNPSKKEIEELGKSRIDAGYRLGRAWEISVYSDGRQCVLPPSVHPDTGNAYAWKHDLSRSEDLSFIKFKIPETETKAKFGDYSPSRPREKFNFAPDEVDVSWLPVSDEIRDGIVTGDGVDDRSEFLLRAASALNSTGLNRDQILSVLTHSDNYISSCAYEHAQTKRRERAAYWLWKYTVRKILLERPGFLAFDDKPKAKARKLTKEEQAAQNKELGEMVDWKDDLEKNKSGRIIPTLGNLELIFNNKAENVFVRDLFSNRLVYGTDSPWRGGKGKIRKKGQLFEDIDSTLLRSWLGNKFGFEPPGNLVFEASVLRGYANSFHPVRRWLKSLNWDGVPRINTWIKDYCLGKAPEPYLSDISRKFLVAMVKRVFKPGCQWDYVLVLEGAQGKMKSTIARTLAGDEWFMDNLPDLRDKDAMLNLQGKWLVELGELADVKRTDYNLVKQYLIRRIDTVRSPYGKIREDLPRQSVFIGTVNEGQYLKDPTGNRRFWPVKVGLCDVKGLAVVREQLFAEAYQVYISGEELFLKDSANTQATKAQEQRRVHDDSTEMKDRLLEFLHSDNGERFLKEKFRARELFEGVEAPWGSWKPVGWTLNTAAQALHSAGFRQLPKSRDGRYWLATSRVEVKNREAAQNEK